MNPYRTLETLLLGAVSSERLMDDGSMTPTREPLKVLEWSYPNLREVISSNAVLDFGCGFGDQVAAMNEKYGALVTGVDTDLSYIEAARKRYPSLEFVTEVPVGRTWDVVVSINAMEHYTDPDAALQAMLRLTRRGGRVLITFGPPWWAPYGSHMDLFCRLPWAQLWFSEAAIMSVRSRYRSDGAKRFEDIQGGLNRMSLGKFERILSRHCSQKSVTVRYVGVKKIQAPTRIPVVRELCTNHVIAEIST